MKKLLIANRGEIVVRIIRAARDLGLKTVAVYSEADQNAPHLREADEALPIGPAAPPKSYLNIERIMAAVGKSGADAVHPGYGFLSENAAFARAVTAAGVAFVGPSPDILSRIESKCFCRQLSHSAGVPVVPGTLATVRDAEEIRGVFRKHGGPLLLKLDKGGGGQGIQPIHEAHEIDNVLTASRSKGKIAFGSSDCYVEKGLRRARHIEVQFIRDTHGNVITLGERECSIQRRYQKIIEESPSPVVTAEERGMLQEWTVRLAAKMGYQSAGTIEYLRSEDGRYYFMEVNARIQVEHPVTEFVTGVDIVKCQLEIAAGKRLAIAQEDVQFNGHAIQARIYAEDPVSFFPSPGVISKLRFPVIRKVKTRLDHALEEGMTVSPYYDPLLAKVIVWGSTRPRAIARLGKRLACFQVEGAKTSIPLARMILDSDDFVQGNFNTESLGEIMQRYAFDAEKNQYHRI
ncbi:MAG: biotin carboxylase N-terminal domain-containing protein [Desulfobacterales bacterium]